jgi:uncharacterized protein (DUF1800 family)
MAISRNDASRFLAQASLGGTAADIVRVQTLGYAGWLEEQFALAQSESRVAWLRRKKYDDAAFLDKGWNEFDAASWRKLLSSADTLRQRVALALSEILVVGMDGLNNRWRHFTGAAYQDLLENNAFGNYRTLLEQVSTSPAMGEFLTFRGNRRGSPLTGRQPDENYARELMQLFTIGLIKLNPDGTPQLVGGVQQPTYGQSDISGLARVWTGWVYDSAGSGSDTPDEKVRPMRQSPAAHEPGSKAFLGTTIAAKTNGETSMRLALDTLFRHPNVGPFVGRQLIQRLVTSNPSPAYVRRVASVFADNGGGVRGDLKAVVRAVLLDEEARATPTGTVSGKLREPMLRFIHLIRLLGATSPSDDWQVGNLSAPDSKLGQSPLRSPSVFNFFRPGYSPPNTVTGAAGLVAPEFQIAGTVSVFGYITCIINTLFNRSDIGDLRFDPSALTALAKTATPLVDELNTLLAAGQLTRDTTTLIAGAIDTMPSATDVDLVNRVGTALTLVMAAPQYIVMR